MVMITSMRTSSAHILVGAWQLIPMDHLFSCVYSPLMMLLLRKQVQSPMVALFGPIPTPVAWYSGWILVCQRQHLLPGTELIVLEKTRSSLDKNYPMMVKGDPTVVDTTLTVPFMRSNYVYTSDIWVVPYPGTDIVGRFSLDDQSCVGLQINNGWPIPENHLWFKASVSNTEEWLS